MRPVFTGTRIHFATIALISDFQLSWRVHFKISFDKIDFDDIGYRKMLFTRIKYVIVIDMLLICTSLLTL